MTRWSQDEVREALAFTGGTVVGRILSDELRALSTELAEVRRQHARAVAMLGQIDRLPQEWRSYADCLEQNDPDKNAVIARVRRGCAEELHDLLHPYPPERTPPHDPHPTHVCNAPAPDHHRARRLRARRRADAS